MSFACKELLSTIMEIEERAFKQDYNKRLSYVMFGQKITVIILTLLLIYLFNWIRKLNDWKPEIEFIIFIVIVIIFILLVIGLSNTKCFKATREFEKNEKYKERAKKLSRSLKSIFMAKDYKDILVEINTRLEQKERQLDRIFAIIGYLATIILLSPMVSFLTTALAQQPKSINKTFGNFIYLLCLIFLASLMVFFVSLIFKCQLSIGLEEFLSFTEKSKLLKCKKYIEAILFYHLVETDNSETEREQKALLNTNKEIIKTLKAIQTEIADLNYPKKFKKALTEKD